MSSYNNKEIKIKSKLFTGLTILSFISTAAVAKDLAWSGFLDTYYAYDFNDPKERDRSYTTQPSRHNEFNINLAYIDIELKEPERRGRIALQHGTSVDSNYAGESNKSLQVIQEAFVGFKLAEKLGMDAGIFFSHIGHESFISKHNINYTRSLNADNVPYYQTGVRFDYEINERESFQLHILNGWQRINENNSGKALGTQYKRVLNDSSTFTYNTFFGDELETSAKSRFRTYHNFMFESKFAELLAQYSLDMGTQAQEDEKGIDTWYATSLMIGHKLDSKSQVGYRLEYYLDKDQANVVTNTPNGFQVLSISINFDREIAKETFWRTELRSFSSKDKIFQSLDDQLKGLNSLLVTSISISF